MPTPPSCLDDCVMDDISTFESANVPTIQSSWHNSYDTSTSKSNKRKFLADRDESLPPVSPSSKIARKRRSGHRSASSFFYGDVHCNALESKQSNHHSCRNCGHHVNTHEWDNLNGCIHHPGRYDGRWSCCDSAEFVPGCIVSKHQELDLGVWRNDRGASMAECGAQYFGHHESEVVYQFGMPTPSEMT